MIVTEPMETIHLYYEQEGPTPPTGGFDGWIVLVSWCVSHCVWRVCSIPPALETVIVPAHFLPLKTLFSPNNHYPNRGENLSSDRRHMGYLPSIMALLLLSLPEGIILTAKNGVEVTTDEQRYCASWQPTCLWHCHHCAHAATSGIRGNIAANAINQIYGSSLYIRNLTAFSGGKRAFSITYTTPQDRLTALSRARV